MFFDPGTKTETKADPLTLPAFIAWLETMPANEAYQFMNCSGGCLIGQYMTAIGVGWDGDLYAQDGGYHDTFARIASRQPHTFGAALERARKLVA